MPEIILPGYAISIVDKLNLVNCEKMIGYAIHYDKPQPPGKGMLYIKKLKELTQGLSHERELFERLSQEGLSSQDLVSRMERFYPNGERLTPEELKQYSRKGVGSVLIRLMTMHALKENARAIYTISGTDEGMSFFRKKSLTEVVLPSFKARLFYKLL
ncbi:MAG: hypothetical protein KAT77_00310 [Nanoarchaeota archaeon]|nr:hypothetical protein [Nanoarchaeota archaeon]